MVIFVSVVTLLFGCVRVSCCLFQVAELNLLPSILPSLKKMMREATLALRRAFVVLFVFCGCQKITTSMSLVRSSIFFVEGSFFFVPIPLILGATRPSPKT